MYVLTEHKLGAKGVQHLPDVSQLRDSRGRDCGSRLGYNYCIAPLLWVARGTRGSYCCIALLLWVGRRTRSSYCCIASLLWVGRGTRGRCCCISLLLMQ